MTTLLLPTQPVAHKQIAAPPKLHIAVHVETDVLDPDVARRKANGWLLLYAGHLLRADNPELVLNEGLFWRYDVLLTSPHGGIVGKVGQICVQAITGEVKSSDSLRDEFIMNARKIIASTDRSQVESATNRLIQHNEPEKVVAHATAVVAD